MIYRLFTTTEDKLFDDFMELLNHLESHYAPYYQDMNINDPMKHDLRNSVTDEKFGYYTIVF